MQKSQNEKLHKAPMIYPFSEESGISLGLTAIFILGPFASLQLSSLRLHFSVNLIKWGVKMFGINGL